MTGIVCGSVFRKTTRFDKKRPVLSFEAVGGPLCITIPYIIPPNILSDIFLRKKNTQKMFSKTMRFAVGAGAGMFLGGQAVVHAGSRETCSSLFNSYATEERDGQAYMTIDGFVKSLLRRKAFGSLPTAATRDIESLFLDCDGDSDGYLSFEEYSLFMTLLTNQEADVYKLFRMFDTDNSNTVELEEYKQIMRCLSNDRTVKYSFEGGLTNKFFPEGEGGKRSPLAVEQFLAFITALRTRAVEAEFKAFTETNTTAISHESLVRLLFGGALPAPLQHNAAALKAADSEHNTVSLKSWVYLSELALSIDQIAEAFEVFKRPDADVHKHDVVRAISAVNPTVSLGRKELDLIFLLFADENGTLNDTEFVRALRSKRSWGMKTANRDEPRRNFVQSVFYCMSQPFNDE